MRYTTRVAIQSNTPTRDASGAEVDALSDVTGMESIPATIMPYTDEIRQERYTEAESHWLIVLGGHWPLITTKMWVVNGSDTYEIERVSTTKAHKLTTLAARFTSI